MSVKYFIMDNNELDKDNELECTIIMAGRTGWSCFVEAGCSGGMQPKNKK
jgi:hypothetical protein